MEQNGIWSEDLKIRAFMVDRNREANIVAIQNMCQEVAGNHANFRRLGFADMQAQGMAWVLNRLKIKVLQFPKWTETVTVKTWVSQMSPFSHRHFQITLPNFEGNTVEERNPDNIGKGVVLANIYTIWIPIDTVTKRPKRVIDSEMPLNDLTYDCEMPEKMGFTEGGIFSSERLVQYSDLDMLGHVNNAKYVEWLLDDFYRDISINIPNYLVINYLGEVFMGMIVQIFSQKTDNGVVYSVKNKANGKEVCRAKLNY